MASAPKPWARESELWSDRLAQPFSVPLGLGEDSKLPVSAQLVGPAFKDRQLLTFARALERGFADAATGAPALSVAPDFAGKGGEL